MSTSSASTASSESEAGSAANQWPKTIRFSAALRATARQYGETLRPGWIHPTSASARSA